MNMSSKLLFIFCFIFRVAFSQSDVIYYDTTLTDPSLRHLNKCLTIRFDGTYLRMNLKYSGKDTSSYFKKIIESRNKRIFSYDNFGSIFHGEERYDISQSNTEEPLIKNAHEIFIDYDIFPVFIQIEGSDSVKFTIDTRIVDSIVFINESNSSLNGGSPLPFFSSEDTLIWRRKDLLEYKYELRLKAKLSSTGNNFGFKRAELQQKSSQLSFFFRPIIERLLYLFPFWAIYFFFYAYRRQVKLTDPKLLPAALKWIPILSCLFIFSFFSALFKGLEHIYGGIGVESALIFQRLLATQISLLLISIFIIFYLKRRKSKNRSSLNIFTRKLSAMFSWTYVIYVIVGIIIWIYCSFHPPKFSEIDKLNSLEADCIHNNPVIFLLSIKVFVILCAWHIFSSNNYFKYFITFFFLMLLVFEAVDLFTGEKPNNAGFAFSIGLMLSELTTFVIPLAFAIMFTCKSGDKNDNDKILASVGVWTFIIIYCCYCSGGVMEHFILIPITLIFVLTVSIKFLLIPFRERFSLIELKRKVLKLELENSLIFVKLFETRQYEKLKERYNKRFLSGEYSPAEYDAIIKELENKIVQTAGDESTRTSILSRMIFPPRIIGPQNNYRAAIAGSFISLILNCFYYSLNIVEYSPILFMESSFFSLAFESLKFGILGYLLGYTFIYIRGNSGWKKGFLMGLVLALCKMPILYLNSKDFAFTDVNSLILQEILILTLVGFFAFDYTTIKKIYGRSFKIKYLVQVEGLGNVTILTSIIIAAIVAGITSWFSSQVSILLDSVLKK